MNTIMSLELKTEICVIGGGPAGATVSRRLASLGHEVCLLERESFPRPHIGESISSNILPLLDLLGIKKQIEDAGFYRPRHAFVQWGSRSVFDKIPAGDPGFQVDRGRFDQILLTAARESGVKILQPALARRPHPTLDGKWIVEAKFDGEQVRITADFIIDATGRRSLLGGKKIRSSVPTTALYAYWRNVSIEGVESRVEAGENEWFWGAPLPDGTINAAIFLDSKRLRNEHIGFRNLTDFYRSILTRSRLLHPCLNAQMVGTVRVCDATTYSSESFFGHNSIIIGEAGHAIDPLSSQGVFTAIRSGLQAGAVIHTILKEPENESAAKKFFIDREHESASFHQRQAAKFYAEEAVHHQSYFWEKRRRSEKTNGNEEPPTEKSAFKEADFFSRHSKFKLSPDVKIVLTPCLIGDFIREVPAITHQSLERPAAFLGEFSVGFLLKIISSGKTLEEMKNEVGTGRASQAFSTVVEWMERRNILRTFS